MLISHPQFQIRTLLLAAVVFCPALTAGAAQTPAATQPASLAARTPAEPEIPKSAFRLQEPVKDPFFPQSTRLRAKPPQAVTGTNVAPPPVDLELNGISGSAERRLAIINFRTFAVGEEGEVPTSNGRARIRVVEIKNDSAVVLVNGEQRVLRLRPGR